MLRGVKAAVLLVFVWAQALLAQPYSGFAPNAVRKSSPEYTETARQARIEGVVVLYAEIGTDGRARHIRVIRALGYGLDRKAVESLRRWRSEPALRDGVPVVAPATIEIPFHLPASAATRVRV